MPQVGPALFTAAGWIGGATLGAQIARVVLQTLVLRALSKTPKQGALPINVTLRSTIAARQIVFGQCRCGGAMIDYRTSGSKNKYLWYVIAFAGHQTEDALDGYLDKYKVAASDINNSTGEVTDAAFDEKLTWWTHRGTQAQTADANLTAAFPSVLTSNHRLRGISYDVIRMERSDKAFPNGAPQSVNRVLKGALLYDPRLDTTNGGSGSHRYDDPSTWEYSRNFALAVRWYLTGGSVVNDQSSCLVMYGLKEDNSRVDESYWIAAANKCDEVLTGANTTPGGDQERYTLDLEVSCDQSRRDIFETMLAAAAANLIYVHGKWRLYVGAYDAPAHAFTQDDLHGDLDIDHTSGAEDRFNSISSIYVDADRDYTEQTSKVRTNSAYVAQDAGKDLPREIQLRGVNNEYRAQRVTELLLRQARQMRTVKMRFGRQGLVVAPYETFTFDHSKYGWSGKLFRCLEREVERDEQGAMTVLITARAEASSVYDDLETADYSTGTTVTNSLQRDEVDEPTNLSAISLHRSIEFSWELGAFWELNGIVELWEAPVGSAFGSATRIWTGRGTRVVIQKEDSTPRAYWVRVTTIGGQVSSTEPASTGYTAAALREQQIIADPHFDWSADQSYWQFNDDLFSAGTPTNITLAGSGGVTSGYLQLVGDSSAKYAFNKRSEDFAVVTGQQIRFRYRWMRTSSITSASGSNFILGLAVFTHVGGIPITGVFEDCGTASLTRDQLNAATVNEWQEVEVVCTVVNRPKSSTQLPYLAVAIGITAACTGGTIRIDSVEAHLV